METLIFLIFGIIYAIATASGYNGRYSRYNSRLSNQQYGRYGLIGVGNDFSLEYDRLEEMRSEYDQRLQVYYQNNKLRLYLKNNFCELRLIKSNGEVRFYCKERTDGRKKGRFFEVRGDSSHASTMWAVINMEFTKRSNYDSVKKLYYSLNQGFETTGGLRYFYEPWLKKYPYYNFYQGYDTAFTQNEYCRLELNQLPDKRCVLVCSEIWAKKPKEFMVFANVHLLRNMIDEFAKEKNKFLNYYDLLAKYSVRMDCKVQEINKKEVEIEQKQEQKQPNIEEPKVEIEPNNRLDINEPKENIENESGIEQNNDIKKYNERNIDL